MGHDVVLTREVQRMRRIVVRVDDLRHARVDYAPEHTIEEFATAGCFATTNCKII